MNVGEKLKYVILHLKTGQEILARELGGAFATINRLEKWKTLPSYSTLMIFEELCKKRILKSSNSL